MFDKSSGKIYEGHFLNDNKNGYGKEYKKDSNYYYEGNWVSGLYYGYGYFVSELGTKYEGFFENGQIKGFGTKINSNGEILKGRWKNEDILDGDNCTYIGNGRVRYSGTISEGKFNGAGIYIDTAGNVYEGSFCGNQRTGIGQQIYIDGSVYTGYYFGNQRNGLGTFEFSNGMEYEGGFLDGAFYGTGYLSAEVNEEITIIASDEWDGLEIPQNADGFATGDETESVASVRLPRTGKIMFSNGDMWEGVMSNGMPVAGLGIWTTQEERLARLNRSDCNVTLAAYQLNGKSYDLSSVYDDWEVYQIVNSDAYLAGFNDFYKKHKDTIAKVVLGLQIVSAVLAILPNPIQPVAAAVDIGLSVAQISLKTISTAIDVYDVCVAGNKNLIPCILKDYGKDVAWDALNIILAIPGTGKVAGKIGKTAIEGMGKAGKTISLAVEKVATNNQILAQSAVHLGQIGKVGKKGMRTLIEAAEKSDFFQFVAKNGKKVTSAIKSSWIKTVYPTLVTKYGDDAVRLLFKYGNGIAEQLTRNGDVLVKAVKSSGDDVVRIFLKHGDAIARVARASEYPEAVVRYIKNSANAEAAIQLVSKNASLGMVVHTYGDDAIRCIEKYGEGAISVFEKNGSYLKNTLQRLSPEHHGTVYSFFSEFSNDAGQLYAKYQDTVIELFEAAGKSRQKELVRIINRDGDKAVALLKNTSSLDIGKMIDVLSGVTIDDYLTLRIIPQSNDFIKTLTAYEKEVLRRYTTRHYKVVQQQARSGIIDKEIETLQNIISRNKLPDDITVFRGEKGYVGNRSISMRNGKMDLPRRGDVITNSAFTSTSLKPKYADGMIRNAEIPVLSEIQLPKGSCGLYISEEAMGYAKYQQEVLLNVNSSFKVLESTILPAGTTLADGTVLAQDTGYIKMILQ